MLPRTAGSRRLTTITAVVFTAFAIALTGAVGLSLAYPPSKGSVEPATAQSTVATPAPPDEVAQPEVDSDPAAEPELGQRAVAVFVRAFEGTDWKPRAGELVDLVAVFRRGSPGVDLEQDEVALVRDVRVMNYVDLGNAAESGEAGNDASTRIRLATITLDLSPKEAQLVALARQAGELRVGKCPDAECGGALTAP